MSPQRKKTSGRQPKNSVQYGQTNKVELPQSNYLNGGQNWIDFADCA